MASSLKLSKFLFKAEIGELSLNTSVQCDLSATWKRSNELAKSGLVSLVAGKASFNQTLTLPINMYFDSATNSFQEKKSQFSITLHTNKGDKSAGVVIIDLATILNNKLDSIQDHFKLDKCPDKQATIWLKITSESLGDSQPSPDLKSSKGILSNSSITSFRNLTRSQIPSPQDSQPLLSLQQRLRKLQSQNESLKSQLRSKANIKKQNESADIFKTEIENLNGQVTFLKNEMARSKTIQGNLEKELNEMKTQRHEREKELQEVKKCLGEAYQELEESVYKYM